MGPELPGAQALPSQDLKRTELSGSPKYWNQNPPASKLASEQSLSSGTHLSPSWPDCPPVQHSASQGHQLDPGTRALCRLWQTSEECATSPIHFSQSHQKPVTRQPFSQKLRRDSPTLRSSCPVLLSSTKGEIWGKGLSVFPASAFPGL